MSRVSTEDKRDTVTTEDFFLDPGKVLRAAFATLKCTEFKTTVIPQNY